MALSANATSLVPTYQPDQEKHRRRIAVWADAANQGHIKNTADVTLNASSAQTVVTDYRVSQFSFIAFMPLTANALSAMPTVRVGSQSKGAFTIVHANTASSDKTFRYCLLG